MKLIKPSYEILPDIGKLQKIELAGRTCYKSEDKITDTSAEEFVKMLLSRKHESVLEHANFIFQVSYFQYEHLKSLNLKFFNFTDVKNRYIVSANARAIRNAAEQFPGSMIPNIACFLSKQYPVLFDDFTNDSFEQITLLDNSDLITFKEKLTHHTESVRFICDRGVSHELVRHRIMSPSQESTRYCNYSKDKFGNQITFIQPPFWANCPENDSDCEKHGVLEEAILFAEKAYMKLIELGATPQEARYVLPNGLKTEIVVTANLLEWGEIFQQRTAKAAHPQMRELMCPLLDEFKNRIPEIFDNITY